MASLKAISNTVDSQVQILSPAVGLYSVAPNAGSFLTAGAFIGKLKILNHEIDLYLPEAAFGKVIIDEERDKICKVEYKQELFRLSPENIRANLGAKKSATKKSDQPAEAGFVVRANTSGIFYRKPSPDAPFYVAAGQQIEKGKVLGLIEVMKTFNHVVFQGTGKADVGKITKILVEDAQEVKLGEGLFVVE